MIDNQPIHPGEVLWKQFLDPLNVTVTAAAKALGVTRKTVSGLLNGRQGVSPEMSVRLGIALRMPEGAWLEKQRAYELACVNRRHLRVKRLVPKATRCTDSPACAARGCADCERSYGPQTGGAL